MLRKLFSTLGLGVALQFTASASRPPVAAPTQPPQPRPEVQALLQQAGQAGNPGDKLRLYDAALAKARSHSDRVGEAWALFWIGYTYESQGEPQKALDFGNQALPLMRATHDQPGEAAELNHIGEVYSGLGQPQRALELYNQALLLERAIGARDGEAATLTNVGAVYRALGQPQQALGVFSQALAVRRALGDRVGEATILNDMGVVYSDIGQPRKAIESYEQALPLRRTVADKRGEATTLNNLGEVYLEIGQYQKALGFLHQALPLERVIGNKQAEATTLTNIGAASLYLGQPRRALEVFHRVLFLQRAVQDKRGEAITLNNMGRVHSYLGQPQQALLCYNQVLPLWRAMGARSGEAATLDNTGAIYDDLGQFQKALGFYDQALLLRRAAQDKAGEATTLNNIGRVYDDLGQPQQALAFVSQVLPLLRAAGDKADEASTLQNLGSIYRQLGQPQQALALYHQALSLQRELGDKDGEAGTLTGLGMAFDDQGQPQTALELLNQALQRRRAAQHKAGEAEVYYHMGAVCHQIAEQERALASYKQALSFQAAVRDQPGEAQTLSEMAIVEESVGQFERAASHLTTALAILEGLRAELGALSQAKVSFLASNLHAYHTYIHLLLKQNHLAAAFAWAEKSKARALLDLLAAGKVKLDKEASPEEQQQARDLRRQQSRLNQQLVAAAVQPSPDKTRLAALRRQSEQAEAELQTLVDRLYARHPGLARHQLARTVALPDTIHFVPADTALLDYAALSVRSGTKADIDQSVLLCVTVQNGSSLVRAYPIPRPRAELAEKVDNFRLACADPRGEYQFAAHEIYQALVAPAARQLAGKKRLIVCPDGPLWGLPFQALIPSTSPTGPPTFLAQQFEIDYAYSATAAQAALQASQDPHRPKPTGTLLAFANPDFGPPSQPGPPVGGGGQILAAAGDRPILVDIRDLFAPGGGSIQPLPGTEKEAEALRKDFPDAKILTGQQAQKSTALREAGKYRYLHFATHGLLNDAAPLMSAVVLAQPPPGSEEDQFLTARDLFDLNLSAELVVLSACNTARGEKQAGEGVVGLTWALFAAGAPSQVVSQWSVNDASTAELMKQFYAGLKAGKAKGAALRAAELGLMKDGQHGHPYYWAPFILLGDWR